MGLGSSASGFAAAPPPPASSSSSSPSAIDAGPEAAKLPDYPLYDWLRFVLASVVVLDHHGFRVGAFSGGLAVDVFFALSGWLIGGILLGTRRSELPLFYFNRATRIWIPYAVAIALIYGFALLREGYGFFWLKYLVLDATFTHNIYTVFPRATFEMPLGGSGNQFWSISVEEQFYLFAPLLLSAAIVPTRIGRSAVTWATITVLLLWAGLLGAPIAAGVTAAILRRRHDWRPGLSWRLAATAGAAALLLSFGAEPAYPLRTLFALLVIVATSAVGSRGSLGVVLGGLSFPLYLNHWIGIFAVHFVEKRYLPLAPAAMITVSYLLNVLVALGLYWVVDRQIQQYRRDWYSVALGRGLAATAYALLATGLVAGHFLAQVPPPASADAAPPVARGSAS